MKSGALSWAGFGDGVSGIAKEGYVFEYEAD